MAQWEALLLSVAVETLTILILFAFCFKSSRVSKRRLSATAMAATLITHPAAWTLNASILMDYPFWLRATLVETLVALIEAIVFLSILPLNRIQALIISIIANGLSFGLGLCWFAFKAA